MIKKTTSAAAALVLLLTAFSCETGRDLDLELWFTDSALLLKEEDVESLDSIGVKGFIVRSGFLEKKGERFTLNPTVNVVQIPENDFRWTVMYELSRGLRILLYRTDIEALADYIAETFEEDSVYFSKSGVDLAGVQIFTDDAPKMVRPLGELLSALRKRLPEKTGLSVTFHPRWKDEEGFDMIKIHSDRLYITPFLKRPDFELTRINPLMFPEGTDVLFGHEDIGPRSIGVPLLGSWSFYSKKDRLRGYLKGRSPDAFLDGYSARIIVHDISKWGEENLLLEKTDDKSFMESELPRGTRLLINRMPLTRLSRLIDRAEKNAAGGESGIALYSLPPGDGLRLLRDVMDGPPEFSPSVTTETVEEGGGRLGFVVKLTNGGRGESRVDFNNLINIEGDKSPVLYFSKGDFDFARFKGNLLTLGEFYIAPGETVKSGVLTINENHRGDFRMDYYFRDYDDRTFEAEKELKL